MTQSQYEDRIVELENNENYSEDINVGDYKAVAEQKSNHRYIYDRWIDRVYYIILRIGIFLFAPILLFFAYRLKIKGRKNLKIKGKNKGAMLVSNHVLFLDSLIVKQTVFRRVFFVGASINNKKGFGGYTIKILGILPLSDKFSNQKNLDNAISYYLNKGKLVHVAPEQAMWRGYTKLRPFKNGAFHYAIKNNVPVIPMVNLLKKGNKWDMMFGRKYRVITKVLPAVYPNMDLQFKDRVLDLKDRVRNAMREEMNAFYGYECDVEKIKK